MLHELRAYPTVVAEVLGDVVVAIRRPGWEESSDWAQLLADVREMGLPELTLDYENGGWEPHLDGSETVICWPRSA